MGGLRLLQPHKDAIDDVLELSRSQLGQHLACKALHECLLVRERPRAQRRREQREALPGHAPKIGLTDSLRQRRAGERRVENPTAIDRERRQVLLGVARGDRIEDDVDGPVEE